MITWVFESPRRLVGVLLAAVVVLTVSVVAFASPHHSHRPRPVAVSPAAASSPDPRAFVSAAVAFVKLWAVPLAGETTEQWEAALDPLVEPDLAAGLKMTDLTGLPHHPQDGLPQVMFSALTSCMVRVPLADGSAVLVTVADVDSRLLVSSVGPDVGDQ